MNSEIICRCEEITKEEILEAVEQGRTTVGSVKRATRAGMGSCQGRTCGSLIRGILKSRQNGCSCSPSPDKPRFPAVPYQMGSEVD